MRHIFPSSHIVPLHCSVPLSVLLPSKVINTFGDYEVGFHSLEGFAWRFKHDMIEHDLWLPLPITLRYIIYLS